MRKIILILLFVIVHFTFVIEHCEAQWEPDVRLTNNPQNSVTSLNNAWSIATNGNDVHVVFEDDRNGWPNYEIYYKRSTDNGITWGADTRLTNFADFSANPSIAISGSIVHVAWQDTRHYNNEIYYIRSTDNGITWGVETRLTINTATSLYPTIAVSGSIVYVAWQDARNISFEIYYKRSTDNGISWGADTRLTDNTAASDWPSIAVSGSLVNVVWYDERDGNEEIYYKRSTDGGVNWGADTRLTNNSANSRSPSIAISGLLVHVIWNDNRDGNYEIYYKRSTDNGITWGAEIRLTNNTAYSQSPSIAVSGSIVHFVWQDNRDGNWEIYYKRSTNDGINWEADTRLTNNTSESRKPSIAISNSIVHIVWTDYRDANNEIYYKRNPTGNVGIQNISTKIPSAFSLEQNYPNPFNANSIIRFQVSRGFLPSPRDGNDKVVLRVFDLMGREVATLVNEKLQPGIYSVRFESGNLPSGIYFYRMEAGSFTETRKLILLK